LQDKIARGDRTPAVVKPRTDPVPAAEALISSDRLRLGAKNPASK
jgi:NADH-quinone oxidoreductase subunit B